MLLISKRARARVCVCVHMCVARLWSLASTLCGELYTLGQTASFPSVPLRRSKAVCGGN